MVVNVDIICLQYTVEKEGPKGSAFLRVFGNELRYMEFEGLSSQSLSDRFNVLDMMLKLAQGDKIDLTKSFMLLDSTVSIPTMLGVPLKLSINGTASVSLQAGGKVDMRHMPRDVDIDGYLQPR